MSYMTVGKAKGILETTHPVMGLAATYYRVAVEMDRTYVDKKTVLQATAEYIRPAAHLFFEEMHLGNGDNIGAQMSDAIDNLYGCGMMLDVSPREAKVDWRIDADEVLFNRRFQWFGASGIYEFTQALDMVLEDLDPTKPDPKPIVSAKLTPEPERTAESTLDKINSLIGEMTDKIRQGRRS